MENILEEMMAKFTALKEEADELAKLAKIMASTYIIDGEQKIEELEIEDYIRKSILEMNDIYFCSSKGTKHLIMMSSDWIAVYRILVDWGMLKEFSFDKFEEICLPINPKLRYPVLAKKLSSGYYGVFQKPLNNKIIVKDYNQKCKNLYRRLTIAFEYANIFKAISKGEMPVVKDIIPVWDNMEPSVIKQFTERYETKERSFIFC